VALTLAAVGVSGLIAGAALLTVLLLPASRGSDALLTTVGTELSGDPLDAGSQAGAPVGTGDRQGTLIVDVAGAVVRPGLVRLSRGDRVGDAIAAAGGFSPRVDLAEAGRSLNLAEPISDGAKVVVSELGNQPALGAAAAEDGRVDLNSADRAALEGLPGIGPVTASRIIEAREQQRFGSVDELRTRDVVGEAVFEDIESLVRVSG
jgi:competence protein ComEA